MRYMPALAMLGLLAAKHLAACSCEQVTVCESAEFAPVIFVGELIEGGFESPNQDKWSGLASTARFKVVERFRGLSRKAKEVKVELFFVKGMCAPAPYVNGRTYLVYAERDLNGELKDGMCTSSRDVEISGDDLQYLRRYFTGKTKGTIRGRVAASRDSSSLEFALDHGYAKPVDGARIVVRKGVERWELKSHPDGSYEITGLPAGEYAVNARHEDYETGWAGDSIRISSRGCSIQNIALRARNLVEGSVLDSEGRPVEKIEVSLLSADPKMANAGYSAWTDYSGRFTFRWVTPGVYRLAANPEGISPSSPYPATFYNNASVPGAAEELTIGPRTELSGLNLVLGK